LRALFLGTTGLEKTSVLEQIADIACKEKFELITGLKHQDAKKYIRIYDIDKQISTKIGSLNYASFMDGKVRQHQKEVWKKELESVLKEIRNENPKHVFLSIHGVYYRYNNYFSLIDKDLLAQFNPTVIVTLIDDIYDVAYKVTEKEKNYSTNSSCTLSEALGWRTIEIFMGDFLSENLFINPESAGIADNIINGLPNEVKRLFKIHIPHFVMAVKHNPRMLYRLLFDRKKLVLYASFPITSTRTDPKKIDEINEFKKKLEEKYTVLDPATIDELVIKEKTKVESEYVQMKANNAIEKECDGLVLFKRLHGNYSRSTTYPPNLDLKELFSLQQAIKKQVEKRDYRMVAQSEDVVAYRPYWGGRTDPSGGVDAELSYANDLDKGILAYHPADDGKPDMFFKGVDKAIKKDNISELLKQLELTQREKDEKSKLDTWE